MAADPATRAERAENAALRDGFAAAPPDAAAALGMVRERFGPFDVIGATAVARVPMLNRVLGAGLAPRPDPDALADAVAALHRRGCACLVAVRDEAPAAAAVRGWLERHGFAEGYGWMRFARGPQPAAPAAEPPGVRVRPCGPGDAAAFGQVLAEGFGLPPAFAGVGVALVGRPGWRCHLAETPQGEPAGVGALFVHEGTGWLGLAATAPARRRRGAQGALLRARIADAARLGCDLLVIETGARAAGRPAASYRNILRAGFAERGVRPNLVAPAPARPPAPRALMPASAGW